MGQTATPVTSTPTCASFQNVLHLYASTSTGLLPGTTQTLSIADNLAFKGKGTETGRSDVVILN